MQLAGQFGVSRTVIREAMRLLSAQGLVQLSHGRRATVAHPSPDASVEALGALLKRSKATPLDLVEVRQALEGEIAALATTRAKDEDIRALEEACQALKTATRLEDMVRADVAFHVRLAEATGNPCFVHIMQTLRALFLESVRQTQDSTGKNVHDPILAAVKSGNPTRARQAMLKHIQDTKAWLKGDSVPERDKFGHEQDTQKRMSSSSSAGHAKLMRATATQNQETQ